MVENEVEDAPDPDDFDEDSPNPAHDTELAVLCDALLERGITRVVVRYEGSGDSGGAEEVECEPAGVCLPEGVEDRLRELAEAYCPDGYENNEGGYGTLTVHPLQGLAALEHFDRFEGSEAIDAGPVFLPEELQQRLTRSGITGLTASFDGYGDSGQIDDVTVEPDGVEIDDGVREELESLLLDQLPCGWEINAGSFGRFAVEVSTGRVEVDPSWRTEEDTDVRVTRWKWRK